MFKCGDIVAVKHDYSMTLYVVLGIHRHATNLECGTEHWTCNNFKSFFDRVEENLFYDVCLIGPVWNDSSLKEIKDKVNEKMLLPFEYKNYEYLHFAVLHFIYHSKNFSSYLLKSKLVNEELSITLSKNVIDNDEVSAHFKMLYGYMSEIKKSEICKIKDIQEGKYYYLAKSEKETSLIYVREKIEDGKFSYYNIEQVQRGLVKETEFFRKYTYLLIEHKLCYIDRFFDKTMALITGSFQSEIYTLSNNVLDLLL